MKGKTDEFDTDANEEQKTSIKGVVKMIEWAINATGDQIITVIIMIWLIIATIKIYVKEKNDERN